MSQKPKFKPCRSTAVPASALRVCRLLFGLTLVSIVTPALAQDMSILFGAGPGERLTIQFRDYQAEETWYLTRCQGDVTPDFYVVLREYGDSLSVKAVNSPLEADKTVCVIGRIPNIVKRYMR